MANSFALPTRDWGFRLAFRLAGLGEGDNEACLHPLSPVPDLAVLQVLGTDVPRAHQVGNHHAKSDMQMKGAVKGYNFH